MLRHWQQPIVSEISLAGLKVGLICSGGNSSLEHLTDALIHRKNKFLNFCVPYSVFLFYCSFFLGLEYNPMLMPVLHNA